MGLELVSMTTNVSKVPYYSQFLTACWEQRNDADFPCDVNAITKIAIHDYKCYESYW